MISLPELTCHGFLYQQWQEFNCFAGQHHFKLPLPR